MEKLTKQQIVLVTLLVSFVTSIATGIVTVALMDQAPPGVTQTINRVVERTIEKVVTPPENTNSAAVVTKETIVVSEDDMVVKAIDKNKESVLRIYTNMENAGDVEQRAFIGLGIVVTKDGLIATGDVFADLRGKYLATFDNDTFYNVRILPKEEGNDLYFLRLVTDEKKPVTFTPVSFADSDSLKLGQAIIAWGGQSHNAVFTGIISSLLDGNKPVNNTSTTTEDKIAGINTNISQTDSLSGGPLLNLNGDVVGIKVSANISEKYSFLTSNILKKEITVVSEL